MFSQLTDWALEFARNHLLHYGPLGLAILSFSEAIFFPVPPDVKRYCCRRMFLTHVEYIDELLEFYQQRVQQLRKAGEG